MGLELECFVDPQQISPYLICPICQNVLENPVQTPSEHLFCEAELIEWLVQSPYCPVTKAHLDPSEIKKPGRILTNMLAELQRYCPNRAEGCTWTGASAQVAAHVEECAFVPRARLFEKITEQERLIEELRKELADQTMRFLTLQDRFAAKQRECEELHEVIAQYESFLDHQSSPAPEETGHVSKLAQLRNLRNLRERLVRSQQPQAQSHDDCG